MKRLLAALFTLLPLLAGAAGARTYTVENAFSLEYPDDWTYDNVSYCQENEDDSLWLVTLYGGNLCLEIDMDYYAGYEDVCLLHDSLGAMQAYAKETVEQLADSGVEVESYPLTVSRAGVPFALSLVHDSEDGDLLYAETMAHGWAISFLFYNRATGEVSDGEAALLIDILASFTPLK